MSQVFNGAAGMPADQIPMPMPFEAENIFGYDPASDAKKSVIFYVRPVLDRPKSQAEGRPYYNDVVYVRMQDPGDKTTIHDRPATMAEQTRFPRQWALFQQGRGGEHPGTDLVHLFPDNPSIVATLKHNNVHTVEMLAGLTSTSMQQIGMGGLEWQQRAVRFMENAKDASMMTRMNAELAKRDEQIDALRVQNENLTKLINERMSDTPTTGRRSKPVLAPAAEDEEVI